MNLQKIKVYLFWILTFLITVNDLPSWYLISRVLYFDILWQDSISLGSIFMIWSKNMKKGHFISFICWSSILRFFYSRKYKKQGLKIRQY